MEAVLSFLPLLIIGAIVVLVLVGTHFYEKKRTEALSEVANELTLQFSPEGDDELQSALSHLSLLKRGRGQTLTNLISGQTQSVDLALFDYRYVTGSGKNKSTHKHTVVVFDSPLLNLPAFELGPEGFFHKLAGVFGYQDIDFDGYPLFNKKYLLRGPDEAAIRGLFTEDVVQHFEAQLSERKKISQVEGSGSRLIVHIKPRAKPEETREFLKHAFATFGMFKAMDPQLADQPASLEPDPY